MSRFQSKTALVTGGNSGIGRATAERLAHEGAKVLVTGRDAARLEAVAAAHPNISVFANDAADPGAADALAAEVDRLFGRLDVAFLNAGYGAFIPLADVSPDAFDRMMAVNVRAPLLHARALSPQIADGGAILVTSSVVRDMGLDQSTIYSATKGAVRSLIRALARELAPRQIRVNGVSPGPIETGFFAATGLPEEAIRHFGEAILSSVPLARFGKPEEVAAVATFLLSDEASYVTGSEYVVDGGMSEL